MVWKKRTAWTVDNLADWLAKYDSIHKAGTKREPYNYETWKLIVQDVALDYADSRDEWHKEYVYGHEQYINDIDEEE